MEHQRYRQAAVVVGKGGMIYTYMRRKTRFISDEDGRKDDLARYQ